uniref:BEN domain-containing protein n=1 Tax=Trichogramma kaykai TaxID=54128 RepID=A0ABD2W9Q1_9HYME
MTSSESTVTSRLEKKDCNKNKKKNLKKKRVNNAIVTVENCKRQKYLESLETFSFKTRKNSSPKYENNATANYTSPKEPTVKEVELGTTNNILPSVPNKYSSSDYKNKTIENTLPEESIVEDDEIGVNNIEDKHVTHSNSSPENSDHINSEFEDYETFSPQNVSDENLLSELSDSTDGIRSRSPLVTRDNIKPKIISNIIFNQKVKQQLIGTPVLPEHAEILDSNTSYRFSPNLFEEDESNKENSQIQQLERNENNDAPNENNDERERVDPYTKPYPFIDEDHVWEPIASPDLCAENLQKRGIEYNQYSPTPEGVQVDEDCPYGLIKAYCYRRYVQMKNIGIMDARFNEPHERYEEAADGQIYLGCGVWCWPNTWRKWNKTNDCSIFARKILKRLYGTSLDNICIDYKRTHVRLQNRSPRKLMSPRKLQLYLSLVRDFLNTNPRYKDLSIHDKDSIMLKLGEKVTSAVSDSQNKYKKEMEKLNRVQKPRQKNSCL